MKQGVPRWTTTDKQIVAAYIELVDKICPCVVMVHSQSGTFGFQVLEARPDKVKALVAVEPTLGGDRNKIASIKGTPVLMVYGDNAKDHPRWSKIRQGGVDYAAAFKAGGGSVDVYDLPDMGHQRQFPHDHDGQEQRPGRRPHPEMAGRQGIGRIIGGVLAAAQHGTAPPVAAYQGYPHRSAPARFDRINRRAGINSTIACGLGRAFDPHYRSRARGRVPSSVRPCPKTRRQGGSSGGSRLRSGGLPCRKRVCGTAPTAPINFGFKDLAAVHWNLTAPQLYEHAIQAREATIVAGGALCAETGAHTGRSPKDKHTVVDALTENTVWWDGNRKLSQANFQSAV